MNQLRLCSRCRARATQATFIKCPWTQSSDTASGRRALSRGGNSRPQRRTTSSSVHPCTTSGSNRTSTCRWLSSTEKPPTDTAKISASSRSRFSIHTLRSVAPSPSRNARRTHRVMQWYHRDTAGSTRCARAIVIGGSPGLIPIIHAPSFPTAPVKLTMYVLAKVPEGPLTPNGGRPHGLKKNLRRREFHQRALSQTTWGDRSRRERGLCRKVGRKWLARVDSWLS